MREMIHDKRPFSKNELRRLGKALAAGLSPPPGCPTYTDVMLWHNDFAAALKAELESKSWLSCPRTGEWDITARSKTHDTLVQKLRREELTLDTVQDLAGARIDADMSLDQQLALAEEICAHFGGTSIVKDIREDPHSGYRAVHVWVRTPAGRAEVQIRTTAQSAWANTYERMGDLFGRDIRYGVESDAPDARDLVAHMHKLSAAIARAEQLEQEVLDMQDWLDGIPTSERGEEHYDIEDRIGPLRREVRVLTESYIADLNNLRTSLDKMGG